MAQPTHRDLLRRNEALREENPRLREALAAKDRRIAELEAVVVRQAAATARPEARVAQLEGLLEKATRAGRRQAAPFSKGSPEEDPKKPGRKSGDAYGAKAHRPLPGRRPDEGIDGPLPSNCPDCGGEVQEERTDHEFQVEIPARRRFVASTCMWAGALAQEVLGSLLATCVQWKQDPLAILSNLICTRRLPALSPLAD